MVAGTATRSSLPNIRVAENNQDNSRIGVLLLHGLTGMPSEMRPLSKYLAAQGYRVEVPLLPGHGGTHEELLATTWRNWCIGAKEALDKLAQECDQVFIGGLSMGALLALMAAVDDSRVSGIMLLSTTLNYDGRACPWTQVFLPLLDIFPFLGKYFYWTEEPPYGLKDERLQRLITKAVDAAKRGENTKFGLFRTYATSLRQAIYLSKYVKKTLHKVTAPTLIVHSLDDTITTIRNATYIYSRIGSQDKAIEFLTGCDHVITLDLRKDVVAQKVGEFVARVSQQALVAQA